MSKKAPGKSHRKGITLLEIADMFPTNEAALAWIEDLRWPKGPYCPKCGSFNVQCNIKHRSQTHRCRDCKSGTSKTMFTVRVGTLMHRTHLSYREWAIGLYLYATNIKGISSMKLHRDLGISQKAAWFLLHRLRMAAETGEALFAGPSEVDETYVGGKEGNKHATKKQRRGRGTVGKTAVIGIKDRATNQVRAEVIKGASAATLQGFVQENTEAKSTVFTDDATAYKGLKNRQHETVKHSVGEYVNGMASTNGIESFWSMLKRGHQGIYHKMSPKHLDRYVTEFA